MTTIKIRGKKIKLKTGARPLAEIRKEVTADSFYRENALLGKTLEEMEALVKLNAADPDYNKKLLADEQQYLKELKITKSRKWVRATFFNHKAIDANNQPDPSANIQNEGAYRHNPDYPESTPSIVMKSAKKVLTEPKNLSLPFTHNPGFSTVWFHDERTFNFPKRQRKIVEYLVHHTTSSDRHFVPKSKVMEDLGTPTSEWKNAFRGNIRARDAVIEEDKDQKEVRIRL